jgi:hypothetical protein
MKVKVRMYIIVANSKIAVQLKNAYQFRHERSYTKFIQIAKKSLMLPEFRNRQSSRGLSNIVRHVIEQSTGYETGHIQIQSVPYSTILTLQRLILKEVRIEGTSATEISDEI